MTPKQTITVVILIALVALGAHAVTADDAPESVALVAQSAPVQPGDGTGSGMIDAAPPSVQAQPAPFVPPDDWAGPAMGTGAAGEFAATGLCAPALVTTEMLSWAFTPSMGEHQMKIDQTDTTLTLGDYTVNVDAATRSVTVTGPEGADVLSRDIDRCVVGEGTPGEPFPTIGNWRYSDGTGWRYVDEANPVYSEEVQTTP